MSELWDMIKKACKEKEKQMSTTVDHKEPQRDLWLEIIEEMQNRRQKGLVTYLRPVDASESVNWLKEMEDELLDGMVYCRAAREVFDRLQKRVGQLEEALRAALSWVPEGTDKQSLTTVLEGM
jgi:signal recognition particle GTPase